MPSEADRGREPTVEEIARAISREEGSRDWCNKGASQRDDCRARAVQALYAAALRAASTAADEARRVTWVGKDMTAEEQEAALRNAPDALATTAGTGQDGTGGGA